MTGWLREHPFGTALWVLIIASLLGIGVMAKFLSIQFTGIVIILVGFAWLKSLPTKRPPGGKDPQI